ncbi:hypothetical protein OF83DRAFT_1169587 [Amylostereum chailletii]|nr:hypothetical protein OF83DRAFT_1169587 [Amylostereum chailletii]
MEEAAAVAADYINSLDNLPNEVQHLLFEIKYKDARFQELQQEIQKEGTKYVRHSLRAGTAEMTTKDNQIPQKIAEYYAEADKLCEEKIKLAERIDDLIARTRARLDHDLGRVLALQGEDTSQLNSSFVSTSRSAAQQMNESFRSASISLPEAVPITPVAPSAPVIAPAPKRRKITATASVNAIKLPSPAPMAIPTRTRITHQTSHRPSPARGRKAPSPSPIGHDEDAEGEDDVDEMGDDGEDSEDKNLYCFCLRPSFGEMIGCDNDDCDRQWFHLSCVNVKPPLPEVWYCETCVKKGFPTVTVNGIERHKKKKR